MAIVERGIPLSIFGVPDLVPPAVITIQPDICLGQKGLLGALEHSRRIILGMHNLVDGDLGIVEKIHSGVVSIPPDISEAKLPDPLKGVLVEMSKRGDLIIPFCSQFGSTAEKVGFSLSLRRSDGNPFYLKVDMSVSGFGRGDLNLSDPFGKGYKPTDAEHKFVDFVHFTKDDCLTKARIGSNTSETDSVSQVFVQIAEFIQQHQIPINKDTVA